MSVPQVQPEGLSPTDPRDYRRGILFGSLLVLLGILFGVFLIIAFVGAPLTRPNIIAVVLALTWIAMLVVTGLLLIGKGKAGLSIMYFWSALFIYSFCANILRLFVSRGRDDVYGVMLDGALLTPWLSIAGYFHNRRKQFTGRWGSDDSN
jgi:hypothetical protein